MATVKKKQRSATRGKAAQALPSTIGDNPLDQLLSAAPVKHVARSRRKAAPAVAGPEPSAVLTITVPRSLADQVEHILAVSPELSFDQIMSTSLAEVLKTIKGRNRGRKRFATSVKDLATSVKKR